ncbi:MAG: O-antigen ligase family protein [Thermodesulfobacteriota bacterium]|nr:O-antigen ligase family protein [Thermodesulfobacteriota bacterium]
MTIKKSARQLGFGVVFFVLTGILLAKVIMISLTLGIIALSCAILLVLTIVFRKMDYLLYAWLVLTSVIWFIMLRGLSPAYYQFIGRGIFWGILVCAFAAWAIDIILRGRQFTPLDNVSLKASILVFVLWCTATLTTSVDVLYSFRKWLHIIFALVASYMFYDFFSRDEKNIKRMINIVSLVMVLVSSLTIAVAARALMLGMPIYKEINLWFQNPNVLGAFLMVPLPILVTSGFNFWPVRRFKWLFLSPVFLALLISSSRSAWLAVLVALTFLCSKGKTRLPFAAVTTVVLVLGSITFPFWGTDFYDFIAGERYTGRREIWQAALSTVRDYPLFGIGLGNSAKVVPNYIENPYFASHFVNTHNLYLQNSVEMGFGSVLILLVFYVIFFLSSVRIENSLKSHDLKLVVRGTLATFLALLVHGIFECGSFLTTFDAGEFTVMLPYILMALPFAAKKLEGRAQPG